MARSKITVALLIGAVAVIALALPVFAAGSVVTTVEYASGLEMDIYTPEAPNGMAVLVVHGGGWWSGTRTKIGLSCQNLADDGYTCFSPEYRLSGAAPFPAANHDVAAAVQYIRSLGFSRLGAVGFSAGGNLVGWLAARGVVDVAVSWSAPSKLPGLTWDSPVGSPVLRFAPTAAKRQAASPALSKISVPLLVVSSNNELMPLGQANALYRAGIAQKHLTVLPGTKHALSYFTVEMPETVAWFETYL
jgi:acetyl esterase/lipase